MTTGTTTVKRRLRAPSYRPPNLSPIRRSPRADVRLSLTGGLTGYMGRVRINGDHTARATIADIAGWAWEATVTEIDGLAIPAGLITLELLDGPRAGLFAIGELRYPDQVAGVPQLMGPATVSGRSEF